MEPETVTNEQLVRRVQSGADVSEYMLQLWEQCKGFVAMLARKYQGAAEMDDLMQEGFLALCEAVDAYDPERGMAFISFLAFYIKRRMAMCCQCSAAVRMPLGTRDIIRRYQRFVSDFRREYGREADDRELCAALRVSREQLEDIRETARSAQADSLDRPFDTDDDLLVGDTVPDSMDIESTVLDAVQQEELAAALWPLVDSLDAEQAAVIRAKYRDGMSWAEIAEQTGLSQTQAAAREKKGLWELKRPRRAKVLRPFLDEYISASAYSGNGVGAFNRTWTSSTERVALRLAEKEDGERATHGEE
ncbi:MAG: sigma-70 family RNA polymerase sigma factor [Lachnospiraceae bacterium]|nr:sigma-70 family RNA polymerase sigma factor [Lachnospiraceae bacterium]